MTLTNKQILNSMQALRTLQERKLPSTMTYAIVKNTKAIEGALDTFNEVRRKVIANYSEIETDEDGEEVTDREGNPVVATDEDGNPKWKSENARREAAGELDDIVAEEVEVDIHCFSFSDLPESVEPGLIMPIDFMIEETPSAS